MPDNIYNWIENFFRDHSHCTCFGDRVSEFKTILASIIQGSGLGPGSYVFTASDLHPKMPDNVYNWIEHFFRDHSQCTRLATESQKSK